MGGNSLLRDTFKSIQYVFGTMKCTGLMPMMCEKHLTPILYCWIAQENITDSIFWVV